MGNVLEYGYSKIDSTIYSCIFKVHLLLATVISWPDSNNIQHGCMFFI